jgi:hypothetical protein
LAASVVLPVPPFCCATVITLAIAVPTPLQATAKGPEWRARRQ